MLVPLAVIMSVPTGPVDEIQIVRDFDEPHATLDQPPRQKTPLAELAAVGFSELIRLGFQLEYIHELRSSTEDAHMASPETRQQIDMVLSWVEGE